MNCLTGVLPFDGGECGRVPAACCMQARAGHAACGPKPGLCAPAFLSTFYWRGRWCAPVRRLSRRPRHRAAGDALVCGESIASAGGMDRVRPLMGYCPQVRGLQPR